MGAGVVTAPAPSLFRPGYFQSNTNSLIGGLDTVRPPRNPFLCVKSNRRLS